MLNDKMLRAEQSRAEQSDLIIICDNKKDTDNHSFRRKLWLSVSFLCADIIPIQRGEENVK